MFNLERTLCYQSQQVSVSSIALQTLADFMCPGCGSRRAVHKALNGNFNEEYTDISVCFNDLIDPIFRTQYHYC